MDDAVGGLDEVLNTMMANSERLQIENFDFSSTRKPSAACAKL